MIGLYQTASRSVAMILSIIMNIKNVELRTDVCKIASQNIGFLDFVRGHTYVNKEIYTRRGQKISNINSGLLELSNLNFVTAGVSKKKLLALATVPALMLSGGIVYLTGYGLTASPTWSIEGSAKENVF